MMKKKRIKLFVLLAVAFCAINATAINQDSLYIAANTRSAYPAVGKWQNSYNIEGINNISFADELVKALCVENWDTNGDGELSFEEAAAVTTIEGIFTSNDSITSFDELHYFTGLNDINNNAFSGCTGLKSITIPHSINVIGEFSFQGCKSLTSIDLPNSITYIGSSAFESCCNLINVNLPNSLRSLNRLSFSNCSALKSITIPRSVSYIHHDAFLGTPLDTLNFNAINCQDFSEILSPFLSTNISIINFGNEVQYIPAYFATYTSLTSVTIGNSVTSIGDYAFYGCTGLTSIVVESGNPRYDSRNNCNAIIESATDLLLMGCKNSTIPNSVTSIGSSAFEGCTGLTSIEIPNSVTSIGNSAFEGCTGITSIVIPNSISSISSYAFKGCTRLTSIEIPNSVTSISNSAFEGCTGLTSIVIPNSVTTIDEYAFYGCSSLDTLNFNAEFCANFSGFNPPFKGLNISTINIGNNVKRIPAYFASRLTKLTSVTIPNSVTSIGSSAFFECIGLTSINIPNSVTTIGSYAFDRCTGLTSIVIPNSVTLIGSYAFYGCTGLNNVNITDVGAWCNISFDGSYANPLSYAHHLFLDGSEITNLVIPDTATSIGSYAFYGCTGLTSIEIPNSVTSIGYSAFYGCTGLNYVNITDVGAWCNINFGDSYANPLSYAHHLFLDGNEITSLVIPDTATSIGSYAFYGCNELTNIEIPKTISSIGNKAFYGCSGLNRIIVDDNNPIYNSHNNCNAIIETSSNTLIQGCQNTIIPNSVTSIGDDAFFGCSGLTSINIPKSVTSIGSNAFSGCNNLTDVTCSALTPPNAQNANAFPTAVTNKATLHITPGTRSAYQAADNWRQFKKIVEDITIAESIELDIKSVTIVSGKSFRLNVTIQPTSTINKEVEWSSNAPEIASVDNTGLVRAFEPGTAIITAATTDGSYLADSCVVTVLDSTIIQGNNFSMIDTTLRDNTIIVIPVTLTNEDEITSFQTDIYLPDGFEIVQENGAYDIELSQRKNKSHVIMANDYADNVVRVLCYTPNGKAFIGNDGELFHITVKVPKDINGTFQIMLKNTFLTKRTEEEISIDDAICNLTVYSYIPGDVNDNGTITVTDIVVTAKHILNYNPEPFVFLAADMNSDGRITVTDIVKIAQLVMGSDLRMSSLRATPSLTLDDNLTAEDISLMPGETRTVNIGLNNVMNYCAFQLDIDLPEGLTASNFRLTNRADNHALDVNMIEGDILRVLCYSPTLTDFVGYEGALLTFDVTSSEPAHGDIIVDSIELVTNDGLTVIPTPLTICVNTATSLSEKVDERTVKKVEYFNLTGQKTDSLTSGVNIVVTTYSDGSSTTAKVIR